MIRSAFTSFIVISAVCLAMAQTYTGTGGIIHDDNTLSDYTIDVQDLSPDTLNQAHGLKSVCINLTHTWVSDLEIHLISPDGTNLMLTATKGDDQDNYQNTCFDMDATQHIITANAPFEGSFRPFSPIGNINNGSSGIGAWTLRIWDQYAYADGGEVLDWSLTFGENAPLPFDFDSSALPIVMVSTDNITIPNDPKIPGTIRVIDNPGELANKITDVPAFESNIGIEVRGASSQSFPKKSFGFETQDEFGDDLETELLGLAKEEDWILYAPYTDKSLLRDALTYELGRDMGRYAPRTVFVELFLNGDYSGIYCLEEKIKRDKNRVNITKLNPADTIGDALTGGYILKVDRDDGPGTYFVSNVEGTDTASEIRIVYEDPEGPDLHAAQHAYIQNFFHDFESSLFSDDFIDPLLGYRRYIDVSSFVDFFLVSELGHNVDAYRLSSYIYKDRNSKDSLLHAGPLWDFNLAYGNVNYCNSQAYEGWAFNDSGACGNTPLWWARLMQDSTFVNEVRCRYQELRETVLSTESLYSYIDQSSYDFIDAEERNYDRWPILGVYVWPNNFIGETYLQEITYMKEWIDGRLSWMDDNLSGECLVSGIRDHVASDLLLSPNPANQTFSISYLSGNRGEGDLLIRDITGVIVHTQTVQAGEGIDISRLPAGTYMVSVSLTDGATLNEKLIKL